MLGNFLKIDYIVVCFIKPLNAGFFMGNDGLSSKQVGSQASRHSAAGLGPICLHKHKCGSRTERVKWDISIENIHLNIGKGLLKGGCPLNKYLSFLMKIFLKINKKLFI